MTHHSRSAIGLLAPAVAFIVLLAAPNRVLAQAHGSTQAGARQGSAARAHRSNVPKAASPAGTTSPEPGAEKSRRIDLEALEQQFQGNDRSSQTPQAQASTYRSETTPPSGACAVAAVLRDILVVATLLTQSRLILPRLISCS